MGIRGEDFKNTLVDGFEIAVGDGACWGIIEVAEPVSDFAAALDANDRDVSVGGKNKEVEAAADDNAALGCTGLDNGRIDAVKGFHKIGLGKLRGEAAHEWLVGFGVHRDEHESGFRKLEKT